MNSNVTSPIADTASDAFERTRSAVEGIADDARTLADRGARAVREGTQKLREETAHAAESTVGYIKDEPVKAVLIAAATGAALMALVMLASRSLGSRD